jgi:hypothetical protein
MRRRLLKKNFFVYRKTALANLNEEVGRNLVLVLCYNNKSWYIWGTTEQGAQATGVRKWTRLKTINEHIPRHPIRLPLHYHLTLYNSGILRETTGFLR